MLVFFTGLYTLGVNALVVTDKGEKASMQISDIVKRKSRKICHRELYG